MTKPSGDEIINKYFEILCRTNKYRHLTTLVLTNSYRGNIILIGLSYPHVMMKVLAKFEPKTDGILVKSTKIPGTNKDTFDYHTREGALERLVPPWSILTVTTHEGGIKDEAVSVFYSK